MRITPMDFILIFLVTGALWLASVYCVRLAVPFTESWLGGYHVIADAALVLLAYGLLSAIATRAMLAVRPLQLGEFAMDHPNFAYWKLLMVVFDMGRFTLKPFTTLPARTLLAKLYGARIGKHIAIGGTIEDPHLITIGDSSVIGNQSLISGNMTMNGKIFFGRVTIGNGVTIGANSVVMPNVEIGDNVLLGIGSVVQPGTRIPAGEQWRGNPARKWQ